MREPFVFLDIEALYADAQQIAALQRQVGRDAQNLPYAVGDRDGRAGFVAYALCTQDSILQGRGDHFERVAFDEAVALFDGRDAVSAIEHDARKTVRLRIGAGVAVILRQLAVIEAGRVGAVGDRIELAPRVRNGHRAVEHAAVRVDSRPQRTSCRRARGGTR